MKQSRNKVMLARQRRRSRRRRQEAHWTAGMLRQARMYITHGPIYVQGDRPPLGHIVFDFKD